MELIITKHPGWLQLTLNRPAQKNALNTALLGALAEALGAAAPDPAVRAVVITGAGEHFAAGADINEIADKGAAEAALDPRKAHWAAIAAFPKPLIAAVDGFALGGGFELALMADIMVLGPKARLGLPETNLGIIPGAGGGGRLQALVGRARASRMILLGEVIDRDTALDWGIAAFTDPAPLVLASDLAARLASRAPLALQAAKRALAHPGEERALFEALLDSQDKAEGIAAFRQKRKAEFKGE